MRLRCDDLCWNMSWIRLALLWFGLVCHLCVSHHTWLSFWFALPLIEWNVCVQNLNLILKFQIANDHFHHRRFAICRIQNICSASQGHIYPMILLKNGRENIKNANFNLEWQIVTTVPSQIKSKHESDQTEKNTRKSLRNLICNEFQKSDFNILHMYPLFFL